MQSSAMTLTFLKEMMAVSLNFILSQISDIHDCGAKNQKNSVNSSNKFHSKLEQENFQNE